jgi:hypothetical protein
MKSWYLPIHKVERHLRQVCLKKNKINIQNWFTQQREALVLNSELRRNS